MNSPRYYARSASDNTDDWPFWFIADREQGGLNVMVDLLPQFKGYMPFTSRGHAEWVVAFIDAGCLETAKSPAAQLRTAGPHQRSMGEGHSCGATSTSGSAPG